MADKRPDSGDHGTVLRLRRGAQAGAPQDRRGVVIRRRLIPIAGHLPTLDEPFSPITEQFRMLRVRLESELAPTPAGGRVIAFTSGLPSEGKTTCALNMAIIVAQEINRRVVFLECDLRGPSVAAMVERPPASGISEVLSGRAGVLDVAFSVESPSNLRMVLAGSPPANPVELLGSQQMGALIRELRGVCDLVVIDTPPALDFADACELGSFIDGFLLVVRSGKTPRDALAKTHRQLAGYRILGVILNDTPPPRRLRYGYGHYGGDARRRAGSS